MTARMMRAYGRRVGAGDVEDLGDLIALEGVLREVLQDAVTAMRANHGRSWADIAAAAGTTRSAAHQRWGAKAAHAPLQSGPTLLDVLAAQA